MKIRYQFIIIFFLALTLFVLKEDVVSIINNVLSYKFQKNNQDLSTITLDKEEILFEQKVETPGALRVSSEFLNINNNVKLSKDSIISITNSHRTDNNLIKFIENPKLNLSAERKLQDMFDKQYFEHISPLGVGVGNLGDHVGYEYILIGENLALGNFKDNRSLVDAWMASQGHKENILNKNYTEIGVAVGKGIFEGREVWIAVQHFGLPKDICPTVDQVLLGFIDIDKKEIKEVERDLLLRKDMIDRGVVYTGKSYNEQINEYNNLIKNYNHLLSEIKIKIDNYNNQVKTFNNCLNGLTS